MSVVQDGALRADTVSRIVTGFALQAYKMKQLCLISSSQAWTESFWTETAADLVAQGNVNIAGVPRLANFPYGEVTWTKSTSPNIKHALEGIVAWEDVQTNEIDTLARTFLRIGRGVAKSVDGVIATAILASAGNTVAANATWDNAVIADRDPIQDILDAKAQITIDNYDPDVNGFLVMNPLQLASLLGNPNIRNAGQFYTDAVTRNGVVGKLLGLTLISTNSVTAGGAQVVIAKEACTWKTVVGLTVVTKDDPGIKWTIRAFEVGQIQVKNPDAICSITGV